MFLLNFLQISDDLIVDIDCVKVADNIEVVRLSLTANTACPQLSTAKRFVRLVGAARVMARCTFLAALAVGLGLWVAAVETLRDVNRSPLLYVDWLV